MPNKLRLGLFGKLDFISAISIKNSTQLKLSEPASEFFDVRSRESSGNPQARTVKTWTGLHPIRTRIPERTNNKSKNAEV